MVALRLARGGPREARRRPRLVLALVLGHHPVSLALFAGADRRTAAPPRRSARPPRAAPRPPPRSPRRRSPAWGASTPSSWTGRTAATASSAPTLKVPMDYDEPGGEQHRHRPAQGPGRRSRQARRLAGGQPGRPGRSRHRLRRAGGAGPSATRCSRPSTSSASTPGGPAAATRWTASPTASSTTTWPATRTPTTPAEEQEYMGWRARARERVRRALGRPRRPRHHRGGGPRHGRAARGPRGVPAGLLRRLLRHLAGRDLRRALPRPRGAPGPRRGRGRLGEQPRAGPGPGRRVRAGDPVLRRDCVDARSRFLGDTVEEGLARSSSCLDDIDAEPLPTSGDRDLAVGNAFYGIVAPLYTRSYWLLLSAALKQALDGNGDALMELSDLYSSRGPDGYTNNSSEAIYAINCLDDPSFTPEARSRGVRRLRQGLADLRAGLRVGPDRLCRVRGEPSAAPAGDRRLRARRPSWSPAPRATRPRRWSGPRRWRSSWIRRC